MEPICNSLKSKVWKLKSPREIKHFLWQALSGYVAAASELKERHCGTDSVCQRCGAKNETINHIIFERPPAVQCWALSAVPSSPGSFLCSGIFVNFDTLLQMQQDPNLAESTSMFPWLIWYIWKARNKKCFNNKDISPLDTLQLACHESEAWKLAQILTENIWDAEGSAAKEKEVDGQDIRERWRCMVDASWTLEDTGVGLGFIIWSMEILR